MKDLVEAMVATIVVMALVLIGFFKFLEWWQRRRKQKKHEHNKCSNALGKRYLFDD